MFQLEIDFGASTVPTETPLDLQIAELWGLPDFAIDAVTMLPAPLALSSPDLDTTFPDHVEPDELDFAWAPGGHAAIALYLVYIDGWTDAPVATVSCLATDDGTFSVPPTVWPDWQIGDELIVQVGGIHESPQPVPLNNGPASIAGINWSVGMLRTW